MSVQRWGLFEDPTMTQMVHMQGGPFVTYADHVVALIEARAKWADIGRDEGYGEGYDEGYAAALGKSREAVAPFVTQDCGVDDCTRHYSPALGAIDRLIRAAGQAPAAPLGECPDCGHQQSSHDKDGYCNDTDCFYDTDPCSVSGEAPAAPGEVT